MKYYLFLFMLFSLEACRRQVSTDFITLSNDKGLKATFTPYGARLVSLSVPDKNGKLTNVVWGFDDVAAYRACKTDPYYGAVIGRYGNRIAKGTFSLNGRVVKLDTNDHGNTLHGGRSGFHAQDWHLGLMSDTSVTFSRVSRAGEDGFPGNLTVSVTYSLTGDNGLKIDYKAITDEPTVLNLTNHAFWNLNGPGSGSILRHLLLVRADKYTPVDSLLIPTGRLDSVVGTPFDFHYARKIGIRISDHHAQLHNGKGYDHNFVLKPHGMATVVAQATGDLSGIVMKVYTDQPGLQFYSGNFMAGKNVMSGGAKDNWRSGFCLETQHFPDSPNQPGFPSAELNPGQTYRTTTIYRFSVEK